MTRKNLYSVTLKKYWNTYLRVNSQFKTLDNILFSQRTKKNQTSKASKIPLKSYIFKK